MFRLEGELLGDPDFTTFRIIGGTDSGLPSPGHTTLTRLPDSTFVVDSFFDITYQIEFQGAPGGALDGLSGTTQGTVRMQAGDGRPHRFLLPFWPLPTTVREIIQALLSPSTGL
jgi:hypothetical protein